MEFISSDDMALICDGSVRSGKTTARRSNCAVVAMRMVSMRWRPPATAARLTPGYATAPNYSESLIRLVRLYGLDRLDRM